MELRFHAELYDGFAVDEAATVYGPFGTMELEREPLHFVVKVTASPETVAQGITESALCAEVANYALGKTIESAEKPGAALNGGAS